MSDSTARLGWGILGTGAIARTFARGLARSRTGKLVAVASRSQEALDAFGDQIGSARGYVGYEKLLQDPAIEVVYISTPHPFHAEWCRRAAHAKKHILCEKPLTMNLAEAETVTVAARAAGVFLMEAFMYRCHPQTARLVELIRNGAVGKVGVIQAAFSAHPPFNAASRLFSHQLGGGGILDVGCYSVSMARLIAGAATGQPFANPTKIQGHAVLSAETGVDLYAVATAEFPDNILAQLSCGLGLEQDRGLRIYGSEGSLHVPFPFTMGKDGGTTEIFRKRTNQPEIETISVQADLPLFSIEADTVAEAIRSGALESAAMPIADTLGNMAALDAWHASAGMTPPDSLQIYF